ncbi:putative leader peptide [Streptomyces sp. NPDC001904]
MRKSCLPALPGAPATATRLLVSRRHIDLARVSSAVCPAG